MQDSHFRPVIIIPVYNHPEGIAVVLTKLMEKDLPIILIDDGSDHDCAQVLQTFSNEHQQIDLFRLEVNSGKGAAVSHGIRQAAEFGFTHGVQVDADGQHDVADMEKFLEAAQTHSASIICGCPVYDQTVPRLRLCARYMTHIWVWINTLSFVIKDSMCGYRVYPLAATRDIIDQEYTGKRMDFDPEILVRWVWRGGAVVNLPTPVQYPVDGVSHFKLWQDNILISAMHTRLFFGMLRRSPRLLYRKLRAKV